MPDSGHGHIPLQIFDSLYNRRPLSCFNKEVSHIAKH